MKDEVNNPEVVAELTAAAWRYEHALVTNDVPTLDALFWDAPQVMRFGATENLYGGDEIRAFRAARPAVNLAREVRDFRVVTFGEDMGTVSLEFVRTVGRGSASRPPEPDVAAFCGRGLEGRRRAHIGPAR